MRTTIRPHAGPDTFTGILLALGLLSVAALPAAAQDNIDGAAELEEVVVTGTRIRRSNLDTPTPMATIDAESVAISGAANLGDLINELPQLGTTFTLGNSTRFVGTAGLNTLDLRSLGTDRTLTLVNGRRHVSGSPGSASVDVNTIPVDLVDRVEVITGGASAIYGADAVTGVVNFVMRDNFEGLALRGQGGKSADAPFNRYFASLTVGRNFADDSGNAAISIEYSSQDRLLAIDRDKLDVDYRLVTNLADGDTPGVNDGIPDELLLPNAGLYFITAAGNFNAIGDWMIFNPDGSLRPQNLGTTFPGLECQDCDFLELQPSEDLQPDFERLSINFLMSMDVSDSSEIFAEAKYVNTKANYLTQPSFDFFSSELTIFRDNAYLHPTTAAYMDANGLTSFAMNRFHFDAGQRGEDHIRQVYRIVAGLRGDLSDRWGYEVSATHGQTTAEFKSIANRINDRFFASIDAVRDTNGDIVCRVSIDPTATLPDGRAPGPIVAANDCVPTSIFGEGAVNAGARAYFNADTLTTSTADQTVLTAFVTGELMDLPAGPLATASGLEYREESASATPDALSATGATFLNAIQPENGDFDVAEAFAEVSVPLLAGAPMAEVLELDAAVRYSNYSTIGDTLTWKAGLNWQPVDSLRLRTTVSEAVRAPNISELFGPQNQTFFDADDPCSEDKLDQGVNGRDVRENNCRSLGVPVGFDSQADAATLPGLQGGNPNVGEETADTFTVGLVFTPSFLPDLGITIDYWQIDIGDAIAVVDSQSILNKCVDDPGGINNQFCDLIDRDAMQEITEIRQVVQNVQSFEASGIDYQVNYSKDLFGGIFDLRTVATYLDTYDQFPFQSEPDLPDRFDGEMGYPKWRATTSLRYTSDDWTLSWETRWIDRTSRIDLEERAVDPDARDFIDAPSTFYHDFQGRYRFNESTEVYLGVDNIFDEFPPTGLNGNDSDEGHYDNIGRMIYLGVSWRSE